MEALEHIRQKIWDRNGLDQRLATWRKEGKRIVFTNGCFDLVHRGHVEYLAAAADQGDVLVIGLNSDRSVSRLKGAHRPIIDQSSRALLLAALEFVDAVILFEEDTPLSLIQTVLPDVLVKGADWPEEHIVGAAEVKASGGRVLRIELAPGRSTTGMIERIRSNPAG